MRRVVLEASVLRRFVGRGDDNPVGQGARSAPVVYQNGMRDHGSGGISESLLNHHFHPVCGENLEGRDETGLGKSVGVHSEEKGAVDPGCLSVIANGLRHGQDVELIEASSEGGPPVPGGPEFNSLRSFLGIGMLGVIGRHQPGNVDEQRPGSLFPCQWMQCHSVSSVSL
jgi:hypothetical protein